jgi:hypothetical protein
MASGSIDTGTSSGLRKGWGGAIVVYTDFQDDFWKGDLWYRHLNHDGSTGYSSSVREESETKMLQFDLTSPTSSSTQIRYVLPTATRLQLKLFDVRGRLHRTESLGQKETGAHQEFIDLEEFPNGIYWISLEGERFTAKRKIVVAR